MIHIEKKIKKYEKKEGDKTYRLFFHLDNKEKIQSEKLYYEMKDSTNPADLSEFSFDVCCIALKKVEGLDIDLDKLKGEERENAVMGIIACTELIGVDDLFDIMMEARGLGKSQEAIKKAKEKKKKPSHKKNS